MEIKTNKVQEGRVKSRLYYKRAAVPYLLLMPVVLFIGMFML